MRILRLYSIPIFFAVILSPAACFGVATEGAWAQLYEYAFPAGSFEGRSGPRTNSLIVSLNGEVKLENHDRGFDAERMQAVWSISKSITSLVFGMAEKQGKAHRNDSICKVDAQIPKQHCDIRFVDLLQWTSGLEWTEEYENSPTIRNSSVIAMLYGEGRNDMQKFVLGHKKVAKPGEQWRYSSGDSHLLASLLPKILDQSSKASYGRLLVPLGARLFWAVEMDKSDRPIGSSGIHLMPQTLVEIGNILVNKGKHGSREVVDAEWIDFILTVPEAFKTNRKDHEGDKDISGGGFWLNKAEGTGMAAPWPDAPEDTIVARGHWGQYLVAIPSLKLVAVRTGDTRDKSFQLHKFISLLVQAVNSEKK